MPLSPRLFVVTAALVAVAVMPITVPEWTPPSRGERSSVRTVPRELDGWTSNGITLDTTFLGSVAFSDRIQRRFTRGEEAVEVLVGEDDWLNRRGSIYSAKTAYPGSGWALVESAPIEMDGIDAELFLFRSVGSERLVVHWRQGFTLTGVEIWRSVLGLDRGPFWREQPATIWRFGTDVGRSREAARARLVALAPALHAAWAAAARSAGT